MQALAAVYGVVEAGNIAEACLQQSPDTPQQVRYRNIRHSSFLDLQKDLPLRMTTKAGEQQGHLPLELNSM